MLCYPSKALSILRACGLVSYRREDTHLSPISCMLKVWCRAWGDHIFLFNFAWGTALKPIPDAKGLVYNLEGPYTSFSVFCMETSLKFIPDLKGLV